MGRFTTGNSRRLVGAALSALALMVGACSSDSGAIFKNQDGGIDASMPEAGGSSGNGGGGSGASSGGGAAGKGNGGKGASGNGGKGASGKGGSGGNAGSGNGGSAGSAGSDIG